MVQFDVAALSGADAELPVLARLAGVTPDAFYGAVTALQRLELVQQRKAWRAVLPQALAAKLARAALERLHPDTVRRAFVDTAPPRLLTSFCHRLGLLHDIPGAVAFARGLLAADGMVGDALVLDEEGAKRLAYLAPAASEAAIAALERAWAADLAGVAAHPELDGFVRLIGHLAYDPALFGRAVRLLALLPAAARDRASPAGERITSLFHLYLSGTGAPPAVRFNLVRAWIAEGDPGSAARAIEAALKIDSFIGAHAPEFGAHQRDYGWRPRTVDAQTDWVLEALSLLVPLAACDAAAAGRVLAAQFRAIWGYLPARAPLLVATYALMAVGRDEAIWFAVRETIGYDAGPAMALDATALQDLEAALRPQGAEDLVGAYVFQPNFRFQLATPGEAGRQAAAEAAKMATALGVRAAADPEGFARVAEALLGRQQTQATLYGEGYARQTDDLDGQWRLLTDMVSAQEQADPALLMGFLRGAQARDPGVVSSWLDAALDRPGVARHLVSLQVAVGLDSSGMARWIRGVDAGVIPSWTFQRAGGATDGLDPPTLRPLLRALMAQADGMAAAVDLLSMRLMALGEAIAPDPWAELCRDVLVAYRFDTPAQTMLDHHLGELALKGLGGPAGAPAARQVAEAMRAAVLDLGRRYGDCIALTRALFRRQPRAALDVLVRPGEGWRQLERVVCGLESDPDEDPERQARGPIHALEADVARAWVAEDPETRTERLALAIPFAERGEDGDLAWTPLARELLHGPYGVSALTAFYPRFFPSSGWGEIGQGWVRRRPLLTVLRDPANPALAEAAGRFAVALEERITWAEGIVWRDEDQTFE